MTTNIWFTSDTHFGHKRVLTYRPFSSIEAHDEQLISNWQEWVKPGDTVYHLGDVFFMGKTRAEAIRRRLTGNILRIRGNHDDTADRMKNAWGWVENLKRIKVGDLRIVLCHYSMEIWNQAHHGAWHLYGHSHNNLPDDPFKRSFDVGVDAVAARVNGIAQGVNLETELTPLQRQNQLMVTDYRPFHIEEVAMVMKNKTWMPVDHHNRNTQ